MTDELFPAVCGDSELVCAEPYERAWCELPLSHRGVTWHAGVAPQTGKRYAWRGRL